MLDVRRGVFGELVLEFSLDFEVRRKGRTWRIGADYCRFGGRVKVRSIWEKMCYFGKVFNGIFFYFNFNMVLIYVFLRVFV